MPLNCRAVFGAKRQPGLNKSPDFACVDKVMRQEPQGFGWICLVACSPRNRIGEALNKMRRRKKLFSRAPRDRIKMGIDCGHACVADSAIAICRKNRNAEAVKLLG